MDKNSQIQPKLIDSYPVLARLGTGGQSVVFLICIQKKYFAAKVFTSKSICQAEISVVYNLESDNIIKIYKQILEAEVSYGEEFSERLPVIIYELAFAGDLFEMMKYSRKMGKIPQAICRAKFIEMIDSIQETHLKGFAHRDIKPENYVFGQGFALKLTDFGLAASLRGHDGDGILYDKVGTSIYWAPQVRRGKYEGAPADIFSLGMVLFVLIFGSTPFRSSTYNDEFYQYFKDGDAEKNNKYWELISKGKNNINPHLKSLFLRMFDSQPSKRPTCSELRQCLWLKTGPIASPQEIFAHFSKRLQALKENCPQKVAVMNLLQSQTFCCQ